MCIKKILNNHDEVTFEEMAYGYCSKCGSLIGFQFDGENKYTGSCCDLVYYAHPMKLKIIIKHNDCDEDKCATCHVKESCNDRVINGWR